MTLIVRMLAAAAVVACAAPAAAVPVTVTFTASNLVNSFGRSFEGEVPEKVTGSFTYDPGFAGSPVSEGTSANPDSRKVVRIPVSTFSIDFGGTTIGAGGTYFLSQWTGDPDSEDAEDIFAVISPTGLATSVGSGQEVDRISLFARRLPVGTFDDLDALTLEELRAFADLDNTFFQIEFCRTNPGGDCGFRNFGILSSQSISIDSLTVEATPIPLPASAWMLLSAVGAVGFAAWRKRRAA